MRSVRALIIAIAVVTFGTVLAPGAGAQPREPHPVPWSVFAGVAQQAVRPDTPPPGANDWTCKPSAEHPNPVVLTHGLLANQTVNWANIAPMLANEGYCVFTLTYGTVDAVNLGFYQPGGLQPMERSAAELGRFVDQVLARTGAREVDIVGHSEGTLMPAHYLRFLGGDAKVDKFVALTPLWEGTQLAGLSALYQHGVALGLRPVVDALFGPFCGSCTQFLAGSDYLARLHSAGIFAPGVDYTNIVTRYDELVVPYTSGLGEGPNVRNIVLQDECPKDFAEHAGLMADPNAGGHIRNALDPEHASPVPCVPVSPVGAVGAAAAPGAVGAVG